MTKWKSSFLLHLHLFPSICFPPVPFCLFFLFNSILPAVFLFSIFFLISKSSRRLPLPFFHKLMRQMNALMKWFMVCVLMDWLSSGVPPTCSQMFFLSSYFLLPRSPSETHPDFPSSCLLGTILSNQHSFFIPLLPVWRSCAPQQQETEHCNTALHTVIPQ